MKKSSRLKLLEVCKTRTKKASPDLAGHDMITKSWQGYQLQAEIQSPLNINKMFKEAGPFKNMGFNGKTVRRFQTKNRIETKISTNQKHAMEHMTPKYKIFCQILCKL